MITFKNSSPWANQYNFNTTQSGNITGWNNGTGLPAARSAFGVLVTKSKVYLLGGFLGTTSPVSSILSATIDGSGVIGAFSTDAVSLPTTIAYPCIAVTKDKVFVIGGQIDSADNNTNAVYSASLDTNGTLGTFSSVGTYPGYYKFIHSFVHNNRLYIVSEDSIYSIPINFDGTLNFVAGWRLDGTLDISRIGGVCWWTGSRLYIWGYRNAVSSYCRYATMDQNGAFGTWTNGPAVGATYDYSECVVTNNTVYLIGGYDGVTYTSVYYATITAGVVGTWTSGTSMGANKDRFGVAITSSRIYLLGGKNGGTDQSSVRYASFSGGYSDYTSQFYEATSDGFIIPPKETIVASGAPGKYGTFVVTAPIENIVASGSASDTRFTYSVAEFEKWEMEANSGASLESDFELFECTMQGSTVIHGDISGSFELLQCDSFSGAVLEGNIEEWTASGESHIDVKASMEAQFEFFSMTGDISWSIKADLEGSFLAFTCDSVATKKDTNVISGDFELFECSGNISKVKRATIDAAFIPFSCTGSAYTSVDSVLEAAFEAMICEGEINKSTAFESIKYVR